MHLLQNHRFCFFRYSALDTFKPEFLPRLLSPIPCTQQERCSKQTTAGQAALIPTCGKGGVLTEPSSQAALEGGDSSEGYGTNQR